MGDLEALKTIGSLGLFPDNIKDRVDELSSLGVMSFRPVVTSTALTEDEVVGAEQTTQGTGSDRVHGSGL